MSFAKFFSKSNSSIQSLQGNILECTIEQIHQNRVTINTGLRTSFLCFRQELDLSIFNRLEKSPASRPSLDSASRQLFEPFSSRRFAAVGRSRFAPGLEEARQRHAVEPPRSGERKKNDETFQASVLFKPISDVMTAVGPTLENFSSLENKKIHSELGKRFQLNQLCCFIGIEERRSRISGDFVCSPPRREAQMSRRKFVWAELTKLWHSKKKNRVSGFILNSVNGGFAVAIAGYIAFLPKSLCLNRRSFIGQWRQFSILSMNPKIANIVVKEIKTVNTSEVLKKEPKFQKSHGYRSKNRRFRR